MKAEREAPAPRQPRKRYPIYVTALPALVPGNLWPRANASTKSFSPSQRRRSTTTCLICERTAKPPPNPINPILRKERKRPPNVAVREICFSRRWPYRARVLILRTRGLTPLVLYLDADSTSENYSITSVMDERLASLKWIGTNLLLSDGPWVASRTSVRKRNGPGIAAWAISVKPALRSDYRRI